jgi:transcriptional regulator with XRE-family HTH domain
LLAADDGLSEFARKVDSRNSGNYLMNFRIFGILWTCSRFENIGIPENRSSNTGITAMRDNLLAPIGAALRERRHARRLTQPQLASRLGRSPSRISELERDLLAGRSGKDRLGLLADVCDALDLAPVLVPRERLEAVHRQLENGPPVATTAAPRRAFDDVFVDLSAEPEDG